MAIVITD